MLWNYGFKIFTSLIKELTLKKAFNLGLLITIMFSSIYMVFFILWVIIYLLLGIKQSVFLANDNVHFLTLWLISIIANMILVFINTEKILKLIPDEGLFKDDYQLKKRFFLVETFIVSFLMNLLVMFTIKIIYNKISHGLDFFVLLLYIATYVVFISTMMDLYEECKFKNNWINYWPFYLVTFLTLIPLILLIFGNTTIENFTTIFNLGSAIFTFLSVTIISIIRLNKINH